MPITMRKQEQELLNLVERYNAEIVKASRIKGFAVNFSPITLEVNGCYGHGRYGRSYNLYVSPVAFRFFKSKNLRTVAHEDLSPEEILRGHSFSGLQQIEEVLQRIELLKNDLMLLVIKLRKPSRLSSRQP